MESIKELQHLLLAPAEQGLALQEGNGSQVRIVVLKQYRFHKQLCIELYDAALSTAGKLKNPLTPVAPLDAALQTKDPATLQFIAALGRFQNNPTATANAADFAALKLVTANPLGLSFFLHDPEFSDKVTAGALQPVAIGSRLTNLTIVVSKEQAYYQLKLQVQVGATVVEGSTATLCFDYFVQSGNTLHLAGSLQVAKVIRFFQSRGVLRIHESRFREFSEAVLQPLEDHIEVSHTYIAAATDLELEAAGLKGAQERIIYLSDLGQYVMINPVMRYGDAEIPVLSKRSIQTRDAQGKPISLSRDEAAERSFLQLLLQQHPHFTEQIDTDLTYLYLHRDRFLDEDWFLEAFAQWQAGGISIFGFNQLKGNKRNAHKADVGIRVLSGLNWFNTRIDVRFGKQRATLKQLQQAVRNKSRYVQLDDGTQGLLPQEWIERFAQFFFGAEVVGEDLRTPRSGFAAIQELYNESELDAQVTAELQLYREQLTHVTAMPLQPVPSALKGRLRDYQQQGMSWLHFLDAHGFGGVLADDMGLGKTVQVIAFLLRLREAGNRRTHLVVAPTSLLYNWHAELKRFAPDLNVHVLYGSERVRATTGFEQYDVVLTTYGTLLADVSFLRRFAFDCVFLDESQGIKNTASQRYHAAVLLHSRNRFALTGTPVENNTQDLYAQLSFACPGLLGSKQAFRDLFVIPIDRYKDSKRAAALQQKIAPFVLRRTKEAVARELPDKTEQVLYCPMDEAQRAVYTHHEAQFRDYLEGRSQEELDRQSLHVLRSLTLLRQICDAPALITTDKKEAAPSAKISVLIEQIELRAPRHKILVFSQFVSMLDLVAEELKKTGIGYAYLTGSTRDRAAVVADFQHNEQTRVFLISLKAGGVGLNLTAAEYVYLLDPWWNPAVEQQAIDRAYRIGQHRNVMAIRLICPGTIEEKMMLLQEGKRTLSQELIKTEQDFFRSITREDWRTLLA